MPRRRIDGLRTLVTGASSGIGRAVVTELMRRGARVVALARRADRLEALAAELANAGHFRWHAGDVANRADRTRALELAHEAWGGLDALVNNAGIGALGPFAQADEARLRRIMEVNFFAPVEFIREALPLLKAGRQPIIVNVSSVLGHRAVPGKSEYCASKFALHGFSDALRAELAGDQIDVLLVSPSTTESEFFTAAAARSGPHPQRAAGPAAGENDDGPPFPAFQVRPQSAEIVAHRLVNAMAAGRHEIILTVGGNALVWFDRLCPWLADLFVARWA